MNYKYKRGDIVIIYGPGENDGKFYEYRIAVIIDRDPYFKDYNVRFYDGTEDWILPKYIYQKI